MTDALSPMLHQESEDMAALTPAPLTLTAADGASLVMHPHGAQVTSWKPAGGGERLFLSALSDFGPKACPRGGIPVIFPQFANRGPLPKHGFARVTEWSIGAQSTTIDGRQEICLHLSDSEATRALWPYAFDALLCGSVGGARLDLELSITNTGVQAFTFTAALHSYLAVDDVERVSVSGLRGRRYLDSADGGKEKAETAPEIRIAGEVDRIYLETPPEILLRAASGDLRIRHSGFTDTVIWNPGQKLGATLADLEPDGYRRMLCVEAAAVGRPITLDPGTSWRGYQSLIAGDIARKNE